MNKLILGDIEVSKKEFYESKNAVNLSEVDVNKIVVNNRIIGNNETSKDFIGYMNDNSPNDISGIVTRLCIILLQMSGWIKYFKHDGKNMCFKIERDSVYLKYNEIWNKIKELIGGVKFHSEPIYDDSYIKTKVKTFSDMIKTLFDENEISKQRIGHICIACISVDSVLKIDKKGFFRTV